MGKEECIGCNIKWIRKDDHYVCDKTNCQKKKKENNDNTEELK